MDERKRYVVRLRRRVAFVGYAEVYATDPRDAVNVAVDVLHGDDNEPIEELWHEDGGLVDKDVDFVVEIPLAGDDE